jgi:flagellar biosynthesis protein FlhF
MQVTPFIVDSVPEAVRQIRAQQGPQALVLSVRRLAPEGLARLWRRPRLEVLACRPDHPPAPPETGTAAPGPQEPASLPPPAQNPGGDGAPPATAGPATALDDPALPCPAAGGWRLEGLLHGAGLLRPHAKHVADLVRAEHGEEPPGTLADELALGRMALARLWRKPLPALEHCARPHVLVGPAGVGKTTCLCKWLTQEVLIEGGNPAVWRLDGATANQAEFLNVYAEILGLQVQRLWRGPSAAARGEANFIDLPGVDWRNPAALAALEAQLRRYPAPQLHLVLNAAYEAPLLLAQWRAFACLPLADVSFTHLDEAPAAAKLWNLVLGTNCAVRFLSAGQNIPGEFYEATAEKLLARLFPEK